MYKPKILLCEKNRQGRIWQTWWPITVSFQVIDQISQNNSEGIVIAKKWGQIWTRHCQLPHSRIEWLNPPPNKSNVEGFPCKFSLGDREGTIE